MENFNLKWYQYLFGIFLLLIGLLLLVFFSIQLRFIGIGFITMAYIYFVIIFYSKFNESNDAHPRSRVRDEMMKYLSRK